MNKAAISLCACFCVDISFYLIRVNTKETNLLDSKVKVYLKKSIIKMAKLPSKWAVSVCISTSND